MILTHKLLDAMQFSCELRVWDFIVTEFYAIMQYVKMMQCSLLLSNFYQLKGINQNYNSVIIYSPSCCIILLIKAIMYFSDIKITGYLKRMLVSNVSGPIDFHNMKKNIWTTKPVVRVHFLDLVC